MNRNELIWIEINMMPISIFASRLGIIDLVNKIKIYTNLIKLLLIEIHIILFLFESSI